MGASLQTALPQVRAGPRPGVVMCWVPGAEASSPVSWELGDLTREGSVRLKSARSWRTAGLECVGKEAPGWKSWGQDSGRRWLPLSCLSWWGVFERVLMGPGEQVGCQGYSLFLLKSHLPKATNTHPHPPPLLPRRGSSPPSPSSAPLLPPGASPYSLSSTSG